MISNSNNNNNSTTTPQKVINLSLCQEQWSSETDRVARTTNARIRVRSLAQNTLALRGGDFCLNQFDDVATISVCFSKEGKKFGLTVAHKLIEQTGVIGEKLDINAFEKLEAAYVGSYVHINKIAALVGLSANVKNAETLAKDVAMQVASMGATTLSYKDFDAAFIASELEARIAVIEKDNEEFARLGKTLKNVPQYISMAQLTPEVLTKAEDDAKAELKAKIETVDGVNVIISEVEIGSADALKNLAFQLDNEVENLFFVAGANISGKPNLTIFINKNLVETKGYNAGKMIREIAKEIKGGGGGQPFFASAGGNDVSGIGRALAMAKTLV